LRPQKVYAITGHILTWCSTTIHNMPHYDWSQVGLSNQSVDQCVSDQLQLYS